MDTFPLTKIGCEPDTPDAARTNSDILRFLLNRISDDIKLTVDGRFFFDLSNGPINIAVGPRSTVKNLWLHGPGSLHGINAVKPTTPVLEISRDFGAFPHVTLAHLTISSDGSGLRLIRGGRLFRLEDISIDGWTGEGQLTYDSWDDYDTASYGIRVDDADRLQMRDISIANGSGHGLLVTRWHDGEFVGVCSHNHGTGFKLSQCNGVRFKAGAESNWGYGLQTLDCGVARRTAGRTVSESGSPNRWEMWMENNGLRGPVSGSSGYRYSQAYLSHTSRLTLSGHTGARCNQIRGDMASMLSLVTDEDVPIPYRDPVRSKIDIEPPLPHKWNTNWTKIWPNEKFRPVWADDTLVWPKLSFNNTARREVAYWRLWSGIESPGRFVFRVKVQDLTGAMESYSKQREMLSPRQAPMVCGLSIDPVGGAITPFPIWDKRPVILTGEFNVTDVRSDITLSLNAWIPGMENSGNVPGGDQSFEHRMYVHEAFLWKLPF